MLIIRQCVLSASSKSSVPISHPWLVREMAFDSQSALADRRLRGQMLVHLCLFVLLSLMSYIVYICKIIFEQINDDDDDEACDYVVKLSHHLVAGVHIIQWRPINFTDRLCKQGFAVSFHMTTYRTVSSFALCSLY